MNFVIKTLGGADFTHKKPAQTCTPQGHIPTESGSGLFFMNQFAKKPEIAAKVIENILSGLTRDWLAKQINRYLGEVNFTLSMAILEGTEPVVVLPSLNTAPLTSFADYLTTVDNGQVIPLTEISEYGEMRSAVEVLTELTGSGDEVQKILNKPTGILDWLKERFPSEFQHYFKIATDIAEKNQIEAEIRRQYDEIVALIQDTPEGLKAANEHLGNFFETFPRQVIEANFKVKHEEMTEREVRRLRTLRDLAQTTFRSHQPAGL